MKNIATFLVKSLVMTIITSCSAAFDHADPGLTGTIQGLVSDMEGNPLNHIKVTFDCGPDAGQTTVYTSKKGQFIAHLEPGVPVMTIIIEDIDGEDNGGLFEKMTDKITLIDGDLDDKQDIIYLQYRLTRATSSENSLQSL